MKFFANSVIYEYAPFTLGGNTWRSSEHFFQAQKFIGTPYADIIRNCETPRKALE